MSSSIPATSGSPSLASLVTGLVVAVPPEYQTISPLQSVPNLEITSGISGAAVQALTPDELAAIHAYDDAQWAATGPAIDVTNDDGVTSSPSFTGIKLGVGMLYSEVDESKPLTGDTVVTIVNTGTSVQTYVGTVTAAESAAWLANPGGAGKITDAPTNGNTATLPGGSANLTVIFAGSGPHTLQANVVTDVTNPDGSITPVTNAVDVEVDGGIAPGSAPASTAPAAAPPAATDAILANLHAPADNANAAPAATTSSTPVPAPTHRIAVNSLALSLRSVDPATPATPVVSPADRGPVESVAQSDALIASLYAVGTVTSGAGYKNLFGFYTAAATGDQSLGTGTGATFSARA